MKKKRLKIFAASGLALIMGAGVLCGCLIPMNSAQANTSKEDVYTSSTSSTGLITPKEDDPVVFTTESGLEIKFGNLLITDLVSTSVPNGSLKGFPYITTNDGTHDYVWVVIGIGAGLDDSPASLAINESTNFDYFIKGDILLSCTSEIPAGSVLCLANDIVATGVKNTSACNAKYQGNTYYNYHSVFQGTMADAFLTYYTESAFGLGSIKESIILMENISTYGGIGHTEHVAGIGSFITDYTSNYIFTLSNGIDDSFYWGDYLFNKQNLSLSSTWWLRGGNSSSYNSGGSQWWFYHYPYCHYVDSNGEIQEMGSDSTAGYRPAFVLKI